MFKKLLHLTLFSFSVSCCTLFADEPSADLAPTQSHHNTCGDDCNCGCKEGYPCTCHTPYVGCCESTGHHAWCPQSGYAPPPGFHCQGRDEMIARACGRGGVWLPECPMLFRPLIADPRQITYSAGWRFNDQVFTKNVIDVSFGDSIPFYRWFDVWPWCGDLQIDLEGALWAIFDPLHDSSPLINADYYGGLVLSYAVADWSFRLRGFHISSHIGDEFLINHPHFHRRNASSEYVDFFVSYDWTDDIRLYSGLGYVIGEDEEFHFGRFYTAIGTEVRLRGLGFVDWCSQLYGEPFLAMHFRGNKDFKHHVDSTYVLGYEWGKLCGLCRKVRLYAEYHDGYSLEGQFCKKPTNYFSIRISYGY